MRKQILAGLSVAVLAAPADVTAQVNWTDWTQAGSGVVNGTMSMLGGVVGVTYTGVYAGAFTTGNAAGFWNWAIYDVPNRPTTPGDMIQLNLPATHTLTFSTPVNDLYFAIVSMGQVPQPVTYDFNSGFTVLTEGQGSFGDGAFVQSADGTQLTGIEGHGVVRFDGAVSQLTWTSNPSEFWHGFTVGASGLATPAPTTVPEPMSMMLLGTGLAGVAAARRRRRQRES